VTAQPREVITPYYVDTWVRETDGIDHPGAKVGDAQRSVALARLGTDRLRHDAAEPVQVNHLVELARVPGRSGGEDDRVLKDDARDIDRGRSRGDAATHDRDSLRCL
jgi:hypothetical protein